MTEARGKATEDLVLAKAGHTIIPDEAAREIRRLAHDLSNALEIIVQTSYLLGTTGMEGPAAEWQKMLDVGVEKALGINSSLRKYVKAHSAGPGVDEGRR